MLISISFLVTTISIIFTHTFVLYFRLALAENLESFKIIRIRFVIKAITSITVTVPGSLLDAYARKSAVLTVDEKYTAIRIGSGFNRVSGSG
jgi:hypothetical protein